MSSTPFDFAQEAICRQSVCEMLMQVVVSHMTNEASDVAGDQGITAVRSEGMKTSNEATALDQKQDRDFTTRQQLHAGEIHALGKALEIISSGQSSPCSCAVSYLQARAKQLGSSLLQITSERIVNIRLFRHANFSTSRYRNPYDCMVNPPSEASRVRKWQEDGAWRGASIVSGGWQHSWQQVWQQERQEEYDEHSGRGVGQKWERHQAMQSHHVQRYNDLHQKHQQADSLGRGPWLESAAWRGARSSSSDAWLEDDAWRGASSASGVWQYSLQQAWQQERQEEYDENSGRGEADKWERHEGMQSHRVQRYNDLHQTHQEADSLARHHGGEKCLVKDKKRRKKRKRGESPGGATRGEDCRDEVPVTASEENEVEHLFNELFGPV